VGVVLVCAAVAVHSGCGGSAIYRVRRGDTLAAIAARHGVSIAELARANRLRDPNCILEGQELRIPKRKKGVRSSGANAGGMRGRNLPQASRKFLSRWQGRLHWPVPGGEISSLYGVRSGSLHTGVDIHAPVGSRVEAAADGEVVFAGELRGYGLTVILLHEGGLTTLYAHNERNLVREGQRVKRGQSIARVGTSGRTTGSNLHFEVRYNNLAFDPLLLLPTGAVAEPRTQSPWGG
jgi:murein DD-endopeptidase MepM/ murein hydrolase activator NlpD